MPKTPIIPPGSAPPLAPYSPGVRAGNTIYVSGVLPLAADGSLIGPAMPRRRPGRCWRRSSPSSRPAAAAMADVAYCNIFRSDMAHDAAMNGVYRDHVPTEPPARGASNAAW